MEEKKQRFKLFIDILKENGIYSQGRVYLLWSVFAYYITILVLMVAGITETDIKMDNFTMIVDALQYAMTLFGGYVFGSKFINAYTAIKGVNKKNTDNFNEIN